MFGHQTAHTCELTNLLAVTTGAGIDHQENRIQLLTAIVMFQSAEHGTGNFVAGVRPDVDDLVVALAVRDDALTILLLNLSNLLISRLDRLSSNIVRASSRTASATTRSSTSGRTPATKFPVPCSALWNITMAVRS